MVYLMQTNLHQNQTCQQTILCLLCQWTILLKLHLSHPPTTQASILSTGKATSTNWDAGNFCWQTLRQPKRKSPSSNARTFLCVWGVVGFSSVTAGFFLAETPNKSASSSSLPDWVKMSVVEAEVVAPLMDIWDFGSSGSENFGGALSCDNSSFFSQVVHHEVFHKKRAPVWTLATVTVGKSKESLRPLLEYKPSLATRGFRERTGRPGEPQLEFLRITHLHPQTASCSCCEVYESESWREKRDNKVVRVCNHRGLQNRTDSSTNHQSTISQPFTPSSVRGHLCSGVLKTMGCKVLSKIREHFNIFVLSSEQIVPR